MLFQTPELTGQEAEILRLIDRIREGLRHQLPAERRWVGLLRRVTLARAIRGSNSIEGYNVTLDDAVAAVAEGEPIDAERESWLAVRAYRDAMSYVLQLADDTHFRYDESLIRSLHYMLLKYDPTKSPGRWRPGTIHVLDQRTNDIVYTGPDALAVPDLMTELVAALEHAPGGVPPIVVGAMAHLNLAMIHPFRDGNGRMARCLQTLVLARGGILDGVFSSIEEYLGENTEAYYAVLAEVGGGTWHPERDARPWLRFVLAAHYRQALTLVRRAQESERRWDLVTNEVHRLALPERSAAALFNASMGFRLRNQTYRELADVTEATASRDLRTLTRAGLLDAIGDSRARIYVPSTRLRDLDATIRTARAPIPDPFDVVSDTLPLGL
ncbi:MAG: Fic family protein [Candidatus Limnocylindrales bacterium]